MVAKSNPTFNEAHQWASIFLDTHGHTQTSAQHYFLWLFDWNLTQWVMNQSNRMTDHEWAWVQDAFQRIVNHEPIQYIVGYQEFMGHRFKVTADTLIPREETRGLIDLVMGEQGQVPKTPKVLDIGTGTGILPIMLKKLWPQAQVTGSDISLAALDVAKENARSHQVEVEWIHSDLCQDLPPVHYDLILSNPPYIGSDELDVMDESVKRFEPSLALFAENQGLALYQALAQQIGDYLSPQGLIVLEIGYRQGLAVQALFQAVFPKDQVTIHQDYQGLDRYVKILRKE